MVAWAGGGAGRGCSGRARASRSQCCVESWRHAAAAERRRVWRACWHADWAAELSADSTTYPLPCHAQPVMVIGNVTGTLCVLWFGLSRSYGQAVASRAVG